jgi:hypothetical protein
MTARWMTRSGGKSQPFHVAVNTCPQAGQVWSAVVAPGTYVPSNSQPHPGQSSGE